MPEIVDAETEAVPMDPQVVLAEILERLDTIAEATAGLDESMGIIADCAEAADGALMTLFEDGKERLSPSTFLRTYGQVRTDMEEDAEKEADDDEPGSSPGPAAHSA